MDEVRQFKAKNGNVTYSVKELLGGLHIKLDRIEVGLAKEQKKVARVQIHQKWHKRALMGLYALLGGHFMLMLKLTGVI